MKTLKKTIESSALKAAPGLENAARETCTVVSKNFETRACACLWICSLLTACTLPSHVRHGRKVYLMGLVLLDSYFQVFSKWRRLQAASHLGLRFFWTDPITLILPFIPTFNNMSLPCAKSTHNFNCPLFLLLFFRSLLKPIYLGIFCWALFILLLWWSALYLCPFLI